MDFGHTSSQFPTSPSWIDSNENNELNNTINQGPHSNPVVSIPLPPGNPSARGLVNFVYRPLDYGPLCHICKRHHQLQDDCPSKPEFGGLYSRARALFRALHMSSDFTHGLRLYS
jgi:hypothetical protein